MTQDELIKGLNESIADTRGAMVKCLGMHIVATVEGLGCRIVPSWVVDSLMKALRGPTDREATRTPGEGGEGSNG